VSGPAAKRPEARARCTKWVVNCLPEDDINAPAFELQVAYRGRGLWAVLRHGACLSNTGEWDWEHIPSERADEWLATHRFDFNTALDLAKEAAPKVIVNGHTVTEALADAVARSKEQ
jgi:hypothetical protein